MELLELSVIREATSQIWNQIYLWWFWCIYDRLGGTDKETADPPLNWWSKGEAIAIVTY